jgi:hypothetical protein
MKVANTYPSEFLNTFGSQWHAFTQAAAQDWRTNDVIA